LWPVAAYKESCIGELFFALERQLCTESDRYCAEHWSVTINPSEKFSMLDRMFECQRKTVIPPGVHAFAEPRTAMGAAPVVLSAVG
jgi:hypothetical protein